MIRKLNNLDHDQVIDFLGEEASINLFIIGDIEVFGYDSDFQELWAEFDENEQIKAVLLRFYNSFIPYAKGQFNLKGFAEIITSYDGPIQLSGKANIVELFEGIPGLGKKQQTFFAECRSGGSLGNPGSHINKARIEDIDSILELRSTIAEFVPNPNARDMLETAMKTGTARTYYTEENGLMTACASTTAENSLSAMVVGVCTREESRRQGLATDVMQELFKDVLGEGKILCLFYDNPDAGRIYKRLGFKDIGMWTMYR